MTLVSNSIPKYFYSNSFFFLHLKEMKKWLLYATSIYLAPTKLSSALFLGLSTADLAYTLQTALLGVNNWDALKASALIFKAVSAVSFLKS